MSDGWMTLVAGALSFRYSFWFHWSKQMFKCWFYWVVYLTVCSWIVWKMLMNVYNVFWLNSESSQRVYLLCVSKVCSISTENFFDYISYRKIVWEKHGKKNTLMKMTKNVNVLNSAKHAWLRKSNSSLTAWLLTERKPFVLMNKWGGTVLQTKQRDTAFVSFCL